MVKIDLIAAVRPNFMKVAPPYQAFRVEAGCCKVSLVHPGQHYDANMSEVIFADPGLPEPASHQDVGSARAEQTGGVMNAGTWWFGIPRVFFSDRSSVCFASKANAAAI